MKKIILIIYIIIVIIYLIKSIIIEKFRGGRASSYKGSKKKQTVNDKLCSIRQAFDKYDLISAIHAFLSVENPKFNRMIPPLRTLNENEQKDLLSSLKKLDFLPEKNMAA